MSLTISAFGAGDAPSNTDVGKFDHIGFLAQSYRMPDKRSYSSQLARIKPHSQKKKSCLALKMHHHEFSAGFKFSITS